MQNHGEPSPAKRKCDVAADPVLEQSNALRRPFLTTALAVQNGTFWYEKSSGSQGEASVSGACKEKNGTDLDVVPFSLPDAMNTLERVRTPTNTSSRCSY
jgi:hypothetical protein